MSVSGFARKVVRPFWNRIQDHDPILPPEISVRRNALKAFQPHGNVYQPPRSLSQWFSKKPLNGYAYDYSLLFVGAFHPSYSRSPCCGVTIGIYFDAPYNFVLACHRKAIACLEFHVLPGTFEDFQRFMPEYRKPSWPWQNAHNPTKKLSEDFPGETVFVTQLQGVRGFEEPLSGIRWERLLLHVLSEWAFSNGFTEVRVQAAKKNGWYRLTDAARQQRFHVRYDVTPRRMGFTVAETGDYSFLRKNGG